MRRSAGRFRQPTTLSLVAAVDAGEDRTDVEQAEVVVDFTVPDVVMDNIALVRPSAASMSWSAPPGSRRSASTASAPCSPGTREWAC